MNLLLAVSVLLVSGLNLQIVDGSLLDPKEDEGRYINKILGDSIPVDFGERVLLAPNHLAASSAVIVTNVPYELVRLRLREEIDKVVGIASEEESVTGEESHNAGAKEFVWRSWPVFGESFSKLKALGLHFDPPKEYEVRSKHYNTLEQSKNHSEAEYGIFEGTPIWGNESTVIIIRRKDTSREWARMWEGLIPLPFKIDSTHHLVTSSELDLVQRSIGSLDGAKTMCFVPSPVYRDMEYWKKFVEGVGNPVKELPRLSRSPAQ
jgi:hypothetical protein